jgi:NADPH:quinone reductase and related Zn-dependent oxidoreductases
MKAFGVTNNKFESFTEFEKTKENPAGRDLLVKIEGISINPVDIATRKKIVDELSDPKILGYDGYGVVDAVGSELKISKSATKSFLLATTLVTVLIKNMN